MAEFGPEFAESVLAACQSQAAEAGAALGRGLQNAFSITSPAGAQNYQPDAVPPAWRRAGLVLAVETEQGNAAFLLSGGEGLLPAWCAHPDDRGHNRLTTLARELSAILLPAGLFVRHCGARRVENLAAVLAESGIASGATIVSLPVAFGAVQGVLDVVWPLTNLATIFDADPLEASRSAESPARSAPHPPSTPPTAPARPKRDRILYERIEEALPYLPVYSRSLLKIKTPVRVTLAATKLPVRQIVDLAPGSLIQFPKSCEESLDLEVGQQVIARGEAVKVGEKFGLRITQMILPGERFVPIGPNS
jgi:flagellar motor switch/type III secretory pathway protein FliN